MSEDSTAEFIDAEEVTASVHSMLDTLVQLSRDNADYFHDDDSENGQRISAAFMAITDHVATLSPLVDEIRGVAPMYDFDSDTPGNGYRSFVNIVDSFVIHGIKIARQVSSSRNNIFFRKSVYMKEVEACSHVLASLGTCLQHLKTLVSWSEPGDLFPDEKHSPAELLARAQNINQYCFYGRCLGFQFCDSMRKALQFICIAMASYSEAYYNNGGLISKATNSVVTGSKYLLDPELRARRIVNISQYSSVDFCKSFWQLAETEVMQRLPSLVSPSVAVNQEISIPPEPLKVMGKNNMEVDVPVPVSHLGPAPIMVRLISANQHEGMVGKSVESSASNGSVLPPSRALLVHCHGGGFVAQSSRSHETYLREWASRIGVPILSVDYSLAPEAPFPRALEEALYAYCWAKQNCHLLGSTGERVVLIGDSAGANLNLGVTMKCIEMGLPVPDGLFLAYVPVLVSFIPSPARLLCLMDPLLPFGFMMRCLKAYAGHIGIEPEGIKEKESLNGLTAQFLGQSLKEAQGDCDSLFDEVSQISELTEPALKSPSKVSDPGSDTLTTVSLVSQPSSQPSSSLHPEDNNSPAARSRRYVAQFLDRYVLDTSALGKDEEQEVLFEAPPLDDEQQQTTSPSFSSRLSSMASSITGKFSTLSREPSQEATSPSTQPLDPSELDALLDHDPTEEFKFTVPKDMYLSPYWASDDILKQLPPIKILTLQLDPCLDDCVMFARKLKGLGNDIQLDVLSGLPHGFLNFSLISKEAHEGSKVCMERIKSLLQLEENITEFSP